jgi:hypothetical protein
MMVKKLIFLKQKSNTLFKKSSLKYLFLFQSNFLAKSIFLKFINNKYFTIIITNLFMFYWFFLIFYFRNLIHVVS